MTHLRQVREFAESQADTPECHPELRSALAWLVAGVDRYEEAAGSGMKLDHVLGLACGPGETPWWTKEANWRRDNALRAFCERLPGNLGIAAQAEAIIAAVKRERRQSKPDATSLAIADAARFGTIPLSKKRLRAILEMK